jgi:hypothetical protein
VWNTRDDFVRKVFVGVLMEFPYDQVKQTNTDITYLVIMYRNLFRIGYNLKVSEIDSSNWHENRYLGLLHLLSFLLVGLA